MANNSRRQQVVDLLKALETGESEPVSVINPNKYIQHNLAIPDGLAGFGALLQQVPKGSIKSNTVRAFEDADYVFAHTEYDFFGPISALTCFGLKTVESWSTGTTSRRPPVRIRVVTR